MFITQDDQRLYLGTWEYNAARILTELAKTVIIRGGRVKPLKNAIVSNRSITDAKQEYTEKIEQLTELEKANHNKKRAATIKTYSENLEALEKVNNEPIKITHTSYINFIYDGFYYYYQMDDNPFFEFYYYKTPVQNGRYSCDTYLTEEKKEWLRNCFFSYDCGYADMVEAANFIFNMLVQAKPSQIHRESKKQRVANIYNDGYHYETVYAPERFAKINF